MHKWLNVLTLLAVIAMFGFSFAMLQRAIGADSPWLAFLLMFYFLGVAKFAEPLVTLRVPRALRELRPWEVKRNAYRWLEVPAFGELLRRTPLRYLNSAVYLNRSRIDLVDVRRRAQFAEACHFWAAVLVMPYIGYKLCKGEWIVAGWFLLAQVLVNVYPILHLRIVRGRLDQLIAMSHRTRVPAM